MEEECVRDRGREYKRDEERMVENWVHAVHNVHPFPVQFLLKVSQNPTQMIKVSVTTEKLINKQNMQRKVLKHVLENISKCSFP